MNISWAFMVAVLTGGITHIWWQEYDTRETCEQKMAQYIKEHPEHRVQGCQKVEAK